jgi:hypothetical protein
MQAGPRNYLRELLRNQIWQSANFVSKALFLVLLTPMMLAAWGDERYGLFALASSLLVSMALLDGGVRNLTRLRLVEATNAGDEEAYRRTFAFGVLTFGTVVLIATIAAAGLAAAGWLKEWFNLPAGGSLVLVVTVALTGTMMMSIFGLEPRAARGSLSSMKAANTWGALVAIPVVAGAVWAGCDVLAAVVLYSLCLIVPNVLYMISDGVFALQPWRYVTQFTPRVFAATLRDGFWYYLTTVALVVKTHALTFVVAAMAGPAEAGIFYILLRFTELIGTVGATASETSLAELAAAGSDAERGRSFRQGWSYVALFSLYGAVGLALLGDHALDLWLRGHYELREGTMIAMAVFGLAGALSRMVVNASMGLGAARGAAIGNLFEAVADVALAAVGYRLLGLPGLFLGGSLGILCMLPAAVRVSTRCDRSWVGNYLRPLLPLLPGLAGAAAMLAIAARFSHWSAWMVGAGAAGILALISLRRMHAAA